MGNKQDIKTRFYSDVWVVSGSSITLATQEVLQQKWWIKDGKDGESHIIFPKELIWQGHRSVR